MKVLALTFIMVTLGYTLGQSNNPESFTRGFIWAFKSAPSECREDLLKNAFYSLFKG